jgi:hypothetical protein
VTRRSVVLKLSAAALVVCAVLAAANAIPSTARPLARVMIVCPLSRAETPTCCGPPVERASSAAPSTQCCAAASTAIACIPSLTISASPDPGTADGKITVSGALLRGAGANVSVTLWQRLAGKKKFSKMMTTTTDSTGSYSVALAAGKVKTSRHWYATANGLTSPTIDEPVAAVVTLRVWSGRHSSTINGTVSPAHAGERVALQRLVYGGWVTIAHPRIGRKSAFRVHYAHKPEVRATLRAVFAGDSRNCRSMSPALTAAVFPRVRAG